MRHTDKGAHPISAMSTSGPDAPKHAAVLAAVKDTPFGRPGNLPSLTAAPPSAQRARRSGQKDGPVEQMDGVEEQPQSDGAILPTRNSEYPIINTPALRGLLYAHNS